jgi:hypothetical protein
MENKIIPYHGPLNLPVLRGSKEPCSLYPVMVASLLFSVWNRGEHPLLCVFSSSKPILLIGQVLALIHLPEASPDTQTDVTLCIAHPKPSWICFSNSLHLIVICFLVACLGQENPYKRMGTVLSCWQRFWVPQWFLVHCTYSINNYGLISPFLPVPYLAPVLFLLSKQSHN